jgi:hypothetical protein
VLNSTEESNLKKLFSPGVGLFIGMSALMLFGSQDRRGNEGGKDRFVGAWRLASLDAPGQDGKIHSADSTGLLVLTRDGHMSVQVMERNPQPQTAAGPEQYSQSGYEASFGTCQIDESAHTFVFHVAGALVRTLIGKDLPRSFEFSGKQLIVKSTGELLGSTTRLRVPRTPPLRVGILNPP